MHFLKFPPPQKKDEFMNIQLTQLLQKCILSGLKMYAIPNKNQWGEVDSQEDLEFYNS